MSRFLVQIPSIEKVVLVDLDKDVLEANKFVIRPLTTYYLNRKDVATDVQIFHGSVTQLDRNIVGIDAVSMVEL